MCCFFFNETATTEIYTYGHTLSLHVALPIWPAIGRETARDAVPRRRALSPDRAPEDPPGRGARGGRRPHQRRLRAPARCRRALRHRGAGDAAARGRARIHPRRFPATAAQGGYRGGIPGKSIAQDMTKRIRKAVFPVAEIGRAH